MHQPLLLFFNLQYMFNLQLKIARIILFLLKFVLLALPERC